MKKRNKVIGLAIAITVIGTSAIALATGGMEDVQAIINHDLKMQFNGEIFEPVDSDGTAREPITYEDRTYIPARAVAEKLGAEVDWDDETKTVIINAKYNAMTGEPLDNTYDTGAGSASTEGKYEFNEITRDNAFELSTYVDKLPYGFGYKTDYNEKDYGSDVESPFDENGELKVEEYEYDGKQFKRMTNAIELNVTTAEEGNEYVKEFIESLEANGFVMDAPALPDSDSYRLTNSDGVSVQITNNCNVKSFAFRPDSAIRISITMPE